MTSMTIEHWGWDEYYINEAYVAALKSKDRSTQVGAVIVGPAHEIRSKGYNGFCRGEDDGNDDFHQRSLKYAVTEHAERNALYNCSRVGIPTDGCIMYCTWGPPCIDCARGVVQSGIKEVVYHLEFPGSSGWDESMSNSRQMFERLGVTLRYWSGVPIIRQIRAGGTLHTFIPNA
jgi:dCMP deaminase